MFKWAIFLVLSAIIGALLSVAGMPYTAVEYWYWAVPIGLLMSLLKD